MELLERQSSLDELARLAREARDGQGRLVLVAGEAGRGQDHAGRAVPAGPSLARWSWGACDGLFTPRPLGPLFDLAQQLGGDLARLCAGAADREDLFGGAPAPGQRPGLAERRGRGGCPLGGRGDHRPAAVPRPQAPGSSRAPDRDLPGREPGRGSSAAGGPRRPDRNRVHPPDDAGPAVRGRGPATGRGKRAGRRRTLPADRRQPLLRDRSGAGRDSAGPGGGPGRRAGPRRPAEQARTRPARRRRADRIQDRAAAHRDGVARIVRADRRAAELGAAYRGRAAADVPPRDRPAGGRAGHPRRTGAAASTHGSWPR